MAWGPLGYHRAPSWLPSGCRMSLLRGLSTNTRRHTRAVLLHSCTYRSLKPQLSWTPNPLLWPLTQPLLLYTNPLPQQRWLAQLVKGVVVYDVNSQLIHLPHGPHNVGVISQCLFVYLRASCITSCDYRSSHVNSLNKYSRTPFRKIRYHIRYSNMSLISQIDWKSMRSDRDERLAHVTILAQWTLIKSAPCSDLIQPLSDVMGMFNEVRDRARCIFCSDSDGEERCWDKNSIWSWHYVPHTRCSPPRRKCLPSDEMRLVMLLV